ncbi:4Fe-4S dicluster domain-containing protein [Candidatus Fermentibacterales bacterium]|nr:4Fe-4S dicluster domain-containing protein [Candidatus Fermentibacterales bacterium]
MRYVSRANLKLLLDDLSGQYRVFVPVRKKDSRFYSRYEGSMDDVVIGEVRAFEPLKAFFFPAVEKVAEGFSGGSFPHEKDRPVCIVGVKACDLKGFKVLDHVFGQEDEYPDPSYIKRRAENLIISSDCTMAIETCFCLALGLKPFPQEDFDINLSPVGDGFFVFVGSDKGKQIVERHAGLFEEPGEELSSAQEKSRLRVIREVERNIEEHGVPSQDRYQGIIEKGYESAVWKDEAESCVECGACNTICPTCHCFLLYEQMKGDEEFARFRMWDSCLIKDFARVGGGDNPREHLWMRLRNRFEKKFDYFRKVADIYACTGCGRCISACPAKIDIRDVLRKLVEENE